MKEIKDQSLKLSVIVPTLNQGKYISETIDSILAQNYPNVEILVMDGGSTDETISILKSYSNLITWRSEKDEGQTNAINKGLKIATGEVLCFLNSDDIFLPGTLARVMKLFAKSEYLWATGDYKIINKKSQTMQSSISLYKSFLRFFNSKGILLITNYIIQPSTFWKRELLQKVGFFNEELDFTMDYEYWLRAYNFVKPAIFHFPVSGFRIHNESKGGTQYTRQFSEQYNVATRYTTNRILLLLHQLHNSLIVKVYDQIK